MKKIEIALFDNFWEAIETEAIRTNRSVDEVILVALAVWLLDHGYQAAIRPVGAGYSPRSINCEEGTI